MKYTTSFISSSFEVKWICEDHFIVACAAWKCSLHSHCHCNSTGTPIVQQDRNLIIIISVLTGGLTTYYYYYHVLTGGMFPGAIKINQSLLLLSRADRREVSGYYKKSTNYQLQAERREVSERRRWLNCLLFIILYYLQEAKSMGRNVLGKWTPYFIYILKLILKGLQSKPYY